MTSIMLLVCSAHWILVCGWLAAFRPRQPRFGFRFDPFLHRYHPCLAFFSGAVTIPVQLPLAGRPTTFGSLARSTSHDHVGLMPQL